MFHDFLLNNYFVYQFNNFSASLLCKINVFNFFDMDFWTSTSSFSDFCYITKY